MILKMHFQKSMTSCLNIRRSTCNKMRAGNQVIGGEFIRRQSFSSYKDGICV
jgi:hypothetical protein